MLQLQLVIFVKLLSHQTVRLRMSMRKQASKGLL
jgi:hypothetical protein